MSSDAPAAGMDIKSFIDLINQITLARYFAGVAVTLCAYDWLILLERESQTTWKARWTRTKAIYYINRVITLVGLSITVAQSSDLWTKPLSRKFCKFYIWFPPILQWISYCLNNAILTLRVVALYERYKPIVRFLYSFLFLNWIVNLAFVLYSLYLLSVDVDYAPVVHLCTSNAHSWTGSVVFAVPAVFEFVLFSLTLYRAIQDVRNRLLTIDNHSPFLVILYRDGLYYFAAVFAILLWNSLEYSLFSRNGIFMGVYFAWSVMSVISSRVYLNLILAAYGKGQGAVTTEALSTMPAPQHYRTGAVEKDSRQLDTFSGNDGFILTTFITVLSTDPTEHRHQRTFTTAAERLTER